MLRLSTRFFIAAAVTATWLNVSPVFADHAGNGKATNDLEVRVQTDKVDFVINGTVVHSAPRAGLNTDGIWGIRSNHLLNINVDGLSVTKQ